MRPLRATLCVLSFASVFPAVCFADDFSDFRIPDHFGGSWNASVAGFYRSGSHNETGDASRDRTMQGDLGGSWLRFRDSDRRQWQLSMAGRVLGVRSTSREDDFLTLVGPPSFSQSEHTESQGRSTTELGWISASMRDYPGTLPIGWELSGDAQVQDAQIWNDHFETQIFDSFNESRTELSAQDVTWQSAEFASLRVAVGAGRVRDATPVFDAILLEERLQRDGALAHPLSPVARQRVADLYAVGPDFNLPHDLPGKFFWRELERTLREDGALADSGFDAYALRHADESLVVARGFFFRPTGWFAGPTLVASHQHGVRRVNGSSRFVHFTDGSLDASSIGSVSDRQRSSFDRTLYGLTAEFHRPLGDRTQLGFSEDVGFDLGPDPTGIELSGFASLQRLIAERWFGELDLSHGRSLRGDPEFSIWSARVDGEIAYFLEDFVRASLRLHQGWGSSQVPGLDRRQDVNFAADFVLTFGRGRLDAPGLIHPQRALN